MTSATTGSPPQADAELPPRPQPPRDQDCCRSDCPRCVFTLYERELERWQERVDEIQRRRAAGVAS